MHYNFLKKDCPLDRNVLYLTNNQKVKYLMDNLLQSYKKILSSITPLCNNLPSYPQKRKPKLSNLELVCLSLASQYASIDSENHLFKILRGTFLEGKIERSVYNRRCRKLFAYKEAIRNKMSSQFPDIGGLFIIDAMPAPICKQIRAKRSCICATADIKPSFGYCASQKTTYYGYKFHAVCDQNGVFHSFDLSPANVHELQYLNDVKYQFKNCEIIGDRGYVSTEYQANLFENAQIKLSVPMRKNQKNFVSFDPRKRKIRKRIENNFSQLHDQFRWNRNYAKSFSGFATRVLDKITAFTTIQYINAFILKKTINKIKGTLF